MAIKSINIRILIIVILFLGSSKSLLSQTDTLEILFDIDVYELNDKHKRNLRDKLNALVDSNSYILKIEGSADYLGSPESNQILSEKRAKSIANYINVIYKNKFPDIVFTGIGEQAKGDIIDLNNEGIQIHRSVKLIIKKNEYTPKFVVGESFVLENLQFELGRHILKPKSKPEREKLLNIMIENPSLEIEIQGHVCCGDYVGDADHLDFDTKTYNLSETRAKSVYGHLIRNGISRERLSYKGYGFDKPLIFPERSYKDAELNRRVEILVVKI